MPPPRSACFVAPLAGSSARAVRSASASKPPAVKNVAKTNYCHVYPAIAKGKVVVFSVIDNLIKGASGQAIQNMNILFDFPETMGLV